jgi:dihydroxyacetone kinase DhaKLM complex PTS-EIIA-like component DhaM
MIDRATIVGKLAAEQAELMARYRALTELDLTRPCTDSEVDGAAPWNAKDHLAHLAMIERAFQGMIRRAVASESNPVGFANGTRDEIIGRVHQGNQANVEKHRGDDLETLLHDLDAARDETLALLDELSDEQLAEVLPGAPWADGTIGGVLITNAYHQVQHLSWVAEGLAAK